MKKTNIIYLAIIAAFSLISCEDYLDRKPLDKIASDVVYESIGYTEASLAGIYNYMPNGNGWRATGHLGKGYGQNSLLDCTTDIIVNKSGWTESWPYNEEGQSPTNDQRFGNWKENYQAIYQCNELIAGMKNSGIDDEGYKTRAIAQARFLRAFFHFDLVRRYGDVPLITELPDLENKESVLPGRTPKAQIYDFIFTEFNEAADDLPWAKDMADEGMEWGQACKEACYGFNGRAMLHAEKYAESAALSKKVIDAVENDSSDRKLADDYGALFSSYGENKEVLFEVIMDGVNKGGTFDNFSRFPSHKGTWAGQHNPTQDLVESYEMTSGLSITDGASGYDPQDPYADRDPRLAQTVLKHGDEYLGITLDLAWELNTETNKWEMDGEVNPNAPYATGLSTITGYYLRKFIDETAPVGVDFGQSKQSWIVLRLAEVYLNYAEAQNEAAGPDQSVYAAINKVRNRSNMPNLEDNYPGLDKTGMFERIEQERKVELCFEGHRFWDVRRWKKGNEVFNGSVPSAGGNGGHMKCCFVLRDDVGGIEYIYYDTNIPTEQLKAPPYLSTRKPMIWNDKKYLMPIPQDEMDKNPNLEPQNPGY